MAQLSIYDKLRHHSDKDFTCSIGKRDRIYITFRHETWKRFTSTEYISVYIGKGGALKFGDPKDTKMLAPCFKLQQGKAGNDDTRETTRYLQIEGKKYPAILEQVRRTAGSYDFPPQKVITIEKALEKNQKANKAIDSIEKNNKVIVEQDGNVTKYKLEEPEPKKYKLEEIAMPAPPLSISAEKIKPSGLAFKLLNEEADAFTVRRNQFKEDLKTLTEGVESQEERIAIINALAGLYGRNNKTVPYDPTDPWDIP